MNEEERRALLAELRHGRALLLLWPLGIPVAMVIFWREARAATAVWALAALVGVVVVRRVVARQASGFQVVVLMGLTIGAMLLLAGSIGLGLWAAGGQSRSMWMLGVLVYAVGSGTAIVVGFTTWQRRGRLAPDLVAEVRRVGHLTSARRLNAIERWEVGLLLRDGGVMPRATVWDGQYLAGALSDRRERESNIERVIEPESPGSAPSDNR